MENVIWLRPLFQTPLPSGFSVLVGGNRLDAVNRDCPTLSGKLHSFMPYSCRIVLFSSWLVVLLLLTGCNAVNPLCGSARPVPILNSISPTTMVFSQLPPSFVITATGSRFVSSSLVVFNGSALATSVISSSQLTANITSSMIPGPGSFTVVVQTPAGTSGDLGCSSGGTSSSQALTVN